MYLSELKNIWWNDGIDKLLMFTIPTCGIIIVIILVVCTYLSIKHTIEFIKIRC